jgi:Ca2+-binding RTX toxin-like protein
MKSFLKFPATTEALLFDKPSTSLTDDPSVDTFQFFDAIRSMSFVEASKSLITDNPTQAEAIPTIVASSGDPLGENDGGILAASGAASPPVGSIAQGTTLGHAGAASAAVPGGASPFVINVSYDSSVASAPAAFKTAVDSVVQYFESKFSDAVTINIDVGYGEVGGNPLGPTALGQSISFLNSYTYAQLKTGLIADAKTADDATAVATLPATSPVNGTFWVSRGDAKAIGLLGASTSVDGYIGFASNQPFDYDNSNGVTAGQYDFFGVVAHEISEVMGRSLLVGGTIGSTPNGYYPLDLFHYSAVGARDFVGTQPGYFSFDNGVTDLNDFNTNSGGDYGDWASNAGYDAFLAFSSSGVVNAISLTDLRELDILGWDRAQAVTQPDLTASKFTLNLGSVSYQINNAGTGPAASSTAGVFLSTDSAITSSDTLLATTATPSLIAGASDSESASLVLPGNLAIGTYYLGALADYNNKVAESNEANNASNAIPVILGNNSDNILTGTAGNDIMFGLAGNDRLDGGPGADTMYGGLGNDTYVVDNIGDRVIENPNEGIDTVESSISYTLPANVENLTLTGSAAINGTGNGLNNVIIGNSGNNKLDGGLGNDQLTGGPGADQFVFDSALNGATNVDTVADFSRPQGDKIDLDHTIFAALKPVTFGSSMSASDFYASSTGTAHLPTDHILYNLMTGALFYDPDGSGAAAATQFATIAHHPTLAASDFLVV